MPCIKANNINMYYEQHGQGEDLLLISGLSADHTAWELQLGELSKHFRVTIFDNRGTGQTDTPNGPYTNKLMADDAIALMESLNIKRAHIAGHSMGGQIAQELGIHYPDRINKIIIICSKADHSPTSNGMLSYSLKLSQAEVANELIIEYCMPFLFAPSYLNNTNNIENFIEKMMTKPHPQTIDGYAYQLEACTTHNTLNHLHKILAPTLVIGGEADLLFPFHNSQLIADKISNATLLKLEGIGHMPNFECPDKYADSILYFLKGERSFNCF